MLIKAKIHIHGVFLAALSCSALMLTSCGFNDIENYTAGSNDTILTNNTELGMIDIHVSDELEAFHTHKRIGNYTSKLAYDLLKNLRGTVLDTPIAVSSFVEFNSNNSSKLGMLISENLLGQLQNQHIPVVDIRLMDELQINNKGIFAFNRDMEGYFYSESVKYVLAGYLTQHNHGLIINARIIQFDNKQVVSSATTLIPHYVADIYN
ncbi:MAG: TolB-like protein [Colwellia sp.]|jgi:TolB-like protein